MQPVVADGRAQPVARVKHEAGVDGLLAVALDTRAKLSRARRMPAATLAAAAFHFFDEPKLLAVVSHRMRFHGQAHADRRRRTGTFRPAEEEQIRPGGHTDGRSKASDAMKRGVTIDLNHARRHHAPLDQPLGERGVNVALIRSLRR